MIQAIAVRNNGFIAKVARPITNRAQNPPHNFA